MRVIFLALIFHIFFQLSHHTFTLDLDLLLLIRCAPSLGGRKGRGEIRAEIRVRKVGVPAEGLTSALAREEPVLDSWLLSHSAR